MSEQINADVALWMGKIAKALEPYATLKTDYGTFSVGEVKIYFDSIFEGYFLVPSESSDTEFDIRIGQPEETA